VICVANSPPTKRKRSWGKETPVRASILREILGQKRIFPKNGMSIYRHLNGQRTFGQNSVLLYIDT